MLVPSSFPSRRISASGVFRVTVSIAGRLGVSATLPATKLISATHSSVLSLRRVTVWMPGGIRRIVSPQMPAASPSMRILDGPKPHGTSNSARSEWSSQLPSQTSSAPSAAGMALSQTSLTYTAPSPHTAGA